MSSKEEFLNQKSIIEQENKKWELVEMNLGIGIIDEAGEEVAYYSLEGKTEIQKQGIVQIAMRRVNRHNAKNNNQ